MHGKECIDGKGHTDDGNDETFLSKYFSQRDVLNEIAIEKNRFDSITTGF